MKSTIKSVIFAGILVISLISNVYATDNKKILNKEVLASEENQFLMSIDQKFTEGNNEYKFLNYYKEDEAENSKMVTAYKTDIIESNTEEAIRNHFGETLSYSDEEYSGTIQLKDYEIKAISNGKYEEIDEKAISFSKYTKNDLDNIDKERKINGITYFLINVNWENDETEIIDGQEVPLNYKGKMIYQAVVQKEYPYSYEITVNYEGVVEKKDPVYSYILEYEKIEKAPNIQEEKRIDYKIPAIIISGLGLAIVIIYLINTKTARIYGKTDSGYKLIKIINLSKKKNKINLNNITHKTITNMYAIKTSNRFYNKHRNMLIQVKQGRISKDIYLNSSFVDFLLG